MSTDSLKKVKTKRIIIFMLILFLTVGFVAPQVYAARVVRDVLAFQQEKSQWCWAATNRSIIGYHWGSFGPSQGDIVTELYGWEANEPASMSQQQTSLSQWGIASSIQNNSLTYAGVKSQINNGHLVNAGLTFTGDGHMNLIRGYDDSYTGVLFIDPADGDYHGQNYYDFKNGIHYNGVWYTWEESLFDTQNN